MNKKDGLSAWQLTMMALGTVVGGSFFLGSAVAIRAAGPAIFISYILGGILVYFILAALSEMSVANPSAGSFRTYSEEVYGSWLGFVVGWVYWTGLVLAMSSEATAASTLLHGWIPQLSLTFLAVIIVVAVTLLNLLGAKILSQLESGLAAIKLGALIIFVGLAIALIIGFIPNQAPVGLGALLSESFFPNGVAGIAGSMLIVVFSYAGFEIIGLAASEAINPHKTVPKAIRYTVIGLVGIYCAVIVTLLPLVRTATLTEAESPMITALSVGGLGWAARSVNFILITAILSTMLAATFGLAKMVHSLAEAGQAPRFLQDKNDIPYRCILFSGFAMLAGVMVGYLLPNRVYIFLVSSGGFSLLFSYVIILLSHYRYRIKNGCPPRGHCQLIGFPYTSWLGIASLLLIIGSMPLIAGQGSGLFAGIGLIIFYLTIYYLMKYLSNQKNAKNMALAKPLLDNNSKENDD